MKQKTNTNYDITQSTNLIIRGEELKVFTQIIVADDNSPYKAFILVLLKELDNDFEKFLRIISIASQTKGFVARRLIEKVIITIREAVVITDIRSGILETKTISDLANSLRYEGYNISRQFIHRTINKYEL